MKQDYRVRGHRKSLRDFWIRKFEYEYPTFTAYQIADRFGISVHKVWRVLREGRYNLGDLPPKRPTEGWHDGFYYCKLDTVEEKK